MTKHTPGPRFLCATCHEYMADGQAYDRLREINEELLAALKGIQSDLEAHDNALTDTAHKRELLAIASETARAAIAKAEGSE